MGGRDAGCFLPQYSQRAYFQRGAPPSALKVTRAALQFMIVFCRACVTLRCLRLGSIDDHGRVFARRCLLLVRFHGVPSLPPCGVLLPVGVLFLLLFCFCSGDCVGRAPRNP